MAHGDEQRIGGELGYTSSSLPVASLDDVAAATPELAAEDVEFDPTGLDNITEEDVQAALGEVDAALTADAEALADEIATPTHVHVGGGALFSDAIHTADLTLTGSLQTLFDLGAAVSGHTYMFRGHIRIFGLANGTNVTVSVGGATLSNFTLMGQMLEAGGAGEPIVSADTGQAAGAVVVPFDTGAGAPASITFQGTWQSGGTTNITIKVSESAGSSDAVTHGFIEYVDLDA